MVLGKAPDPRWSGRLCAKAFTEKLRFLMQHLTMTTATNDPVPLFCRIADADLRLRRERRSLHHLSGQFRYFDNMFEIDAVAEET